MTHSRALLSALYEAAVQGAAPFPCTRDGVARWWKDAALPRETPVYLFALGKASPSMAAGALAALETLEVDVRGGIVVAAHDPTLAEWHGQQLPRALRVVRGDHPVPGPASLDAADAIEDAILDVEPGAVAVVLISGGTTALCAAPIAALSQAVGDADRAQAHVANLAQTLLESGLAIHEMNAIRRRLLRFGAGRLAVRLVQHGVARIGAFAISDVIGDDPSVIGSGPCSPDPLDDASFLALLDAHQLRAHVQRATALVLGIEGDGPPPAVPSMSHPAFARVHYEVVSGNASAVQAMAHAARETGVAHVQVDDVPLEGEADALGDTLARRALVIAASVPRGQSVLLVSGGEPVVHLRDTIERAIRQGDDDDARLDEHVAAEPLLIRGASTADEPLRGGRMQVLALAAALALESALAKGDSTAARITMLAAGTDGRDGPTDAAGAIVDAAVPALARRAGRQPEDDLGTGRSWYPLEAAQALLKPGPTGTNVMDVVGVLVRG